MSENQNQVALVKRILKDHEVDVVHMTCRDSVQSMLHEQECLAVVLDFPNPTEDDFTYWRELLEGTYKPILILSSDQSDSGRIVARQQATIQLAEPLIEVLHTLSLKQSGYFTGNVIALEQNVYFDTIQRSIIRENEMYPLTNREFQLLYVLVQRMGTPITAKELLDLVWTGEYEVSFSNLYHYIRKLREKLECNPNDPKILLTHKKGEGGFVLRFFDEKV
ncbi:winged helix-turn-helix domain-containing protein [Effusibacillus consociatus]|uniref:Winged helix-turn-helix domain-containing protein n=1 Tax=Effusibacillus consociatus TaxID=1117041 RepID=A0ABV9Q1C8_9BACL